MTLIDGQMDIFELLNDQRRVDVTHLVNPAGDAGTFFNPGTPEALEELFEVDKKLWLEDVADQEKYFAQFGDKLPAEIKEELEKLKGELL